MPLVFGLTGGIASGKSTVARMMRERGVAIVDADLLAREVVEPGLPALAEIEARFGRAFVLPSGHLDRAKLGALVFSDPAARAALNAITHPRIAALAMERTQSHFAAGAPFVVYEAALLIENGLHHAMAATVVVWVPAPVQLARLMLRDQVTEGDARARIASQLSLDEKRRLATHVVDNSGPLPSTAVQVAGVVEALARLAQGS